MLDAMATLLRTAGMILLLGGMSPALAGVAWMEIGRQAGPRAIHWPPESYGRRAPARR